jgi:hypothetical protein
MREKLLTLLTVVNLGVLVFTLAERKVVDARSDLPQVVRARTLEIVDGQGRLRASLGVMPAESAPGNQPFPETVLFRLITERGRPAIKVSASEEGAGFMAAGPSGTQNTYITLGSKGTTASIRMKNESGAEQTLAPQ